MVEPLKLVAPLLESALPVPDNADDASGTSPAADYNTPYKYELSDGSSWYSEAERHNYDRRHDRNNFSVLAGLELGGGAAGGTGFSGGVRYEGELVGSIEGGFVAGVTLQGGLVGGSEGQLTYSSLMGAVTPHLGGRLRLSQGGSYLTLRFMALGVRAAATQTFDKTKDGTADASVSSTSYATTVGLEVATEWPIGRGVNLAIPIITGSLNPTLSASGTNPKTDSSVVGETLTVRAGIVFLF